MARNAFQWTGILVREGHNFFALCPEVDVASQGHNARQARAMLKEAVRLYLETCFENDHPCLRPVPPAEDPRILNRNNIIGTFPLVVDIAVRMHACRARSS